MILTLDIGNTNYKIGFWQEDKLLKVDTFPSIDAINMVLKEDFKYLISSNVTQINLAQINSKNYINWDVNSQMPIKIDYKTIETLGKDRIAAANGANEIFKNTDTMIVDAGTCLKIDILSKDRVFKGGSISPGIQMRLKSLKDYTQLLPLVEMSNQFDMPGQSTNDSILNGVVNGIIGEIEYFYNNYKKQYHDLKIVITGGDTNFLKKRLKIPIFAEQNLIHIGLYQILKHQI